MEKSKFPRGYKVYLPLVLLFALLAFVMPRSPKFTYDYEKGKVWMYEDLVSLFGFPLLKSEEQYKAEVQKAGTGVVPFYRQDPTVIENALAALSGLDLGDYPAAKPALSAALERIHAKGVLPASAPEESVLYVQKSMRAAKVLASEVYTLDVAVQVLRDAFAEEYPEADMDAALNSMLSSLVASDLVFDQNATDQIMEQNVAQVSPTMGVIKSGQTLVSKGELITAEIEQVKKVSPEGILIIAYIVVAALIVLLYKNKSFLFVGLNVVIMFGLYTYLWYGGRCNYRAVFSILFSSFILSLYALNATFFKVSQKNSPFFIKYLSNSLIIIESPFIGCLSPIATRLLFSSNNKTL